MFSEAKNNFLLILVENTVVFLSLCMLPLGRLKNGKGRKRKHFCMFACILLVFVGLLV